MGAPNFHCASCGSQVSLFRPDRAHAYFRHASGSACEHGPLRALHAAALQLLVESRFVHAPLLTQHVSAHGKRHVIEAWGAGA